MIRVEISNKMKLGRLLLGSFSIVCTLLATGACSSSPPPETHIVVIKGLKFLPSELTIRKGDTVKWINKDLIKHDVTEEAGKTWTSGEMENEAIYKMAITENTDYFCSLHVVMKGKLIVE